jgi:glycogen debranching enzyme
MGKVMKYFWFVLTVFALSTWGFAQNKIYESKLYRIFSDKVTEGNYTTTVVSADELSSNIAGKWKLEKDISGYPVYSSPQIIVDALYNRALEELTLDGRPDGALMAGEKWPGVWTRDVSYSIILSLAVIAPDASKASLMAKVKDGIIIQDTGTGGAWPVSSDRMVWALAAWEIYTVTGDKKWLADSYQIIKKSAQADRSVVLDNNTGLMRGESSFLDWREQTYPRWMDPKDIFTSINLGTNAIHYRTNILLADMARLNGEPSEPYLKNAAALKAAINKYFPVKGKGYYGQYLYGRNFLSLSPKSEALGEALCVLFDIPDKKVQSEIIGHTPVTEFGIPCIYPQIPGVPPYHNNGVWPFVASYWAWASAKTGNYSSVESAFASIYRAAALFGTNKENFVASTGTHEGTEINSSRQLWSVAGNLALIYRVLFGMEFYPDKLVLNPFIPESYGGVRTLKNFKYRDAILTIKISGSGNKIRSASIDGVPLKKAEIKSIITGAHVIDIFMTEDSVQPGNINMAAFAVAPETPVVFKMLLNISYI